MSAPQKQKNTTPLWMRTLGNRLLFNKRFAVHPVVDSTKGVWRLHYVTSFGFPRWLKKGEKLEFGVKQIEPGRYALEFKLRRDLSRKVYYTNAIAEGILANNPAAGEATFEGSAKFSPFYMGSVMVMSIITLVMLMATALHPIFGLFSVAMLVAMTVHWIGIFSDRHRLMLIVYRALTDDEARFADHALKEMPEGLEQPVPA